ncbi:hypothetical protein DYB34_000340 [Aphanomyces astaci]|uniref:Uncharacterized protein n=1 Tax=Aphanomyces astaci TaxID=112090 RepID=A0A418CAI0_APHAT|nr:hypothetical protein DYB34_000340 [Aphanomyces astaci]
MRRKRHRSIETVVDGAPSWRVSTNLPHHCSTTLRHFCIRPLTRMTSATTVSHASYNQLGNSPSLFTDEDMWTIDTILGSDDLLTLDDDIQKDLDFLTSASTISAHPLTILTTPDALMNQAFASESEACFSPQPRPRPRHSLDMMTLETLPLDVLTFVDHPSKRKSFAGLTVVPMMKSMPSLPVQPQQILNNQKNIFHRCSTTDPSTSTPKCTTSNDCILISHKYPCSFGRNNNAKPSPPPPLPAVTLLLPPVSPVVLSARSSANATARRQHPQPSWEVPEPLTTTGTSHQVIEQAVVTCCPLLADEVTTIEAFN